MDKNSQIFDIFDPVTFKKFNKFIHDKSLSVCANCLKDSKENWLPASKNMALAYPPKVMAVYGKSDGQWKQPGFAHQGPGH
jgi:hypothetical protein